MPPNVRSSPFCVVMVMAPEPSIEAEPVPTIASMAVTKSAALLTLPEPNVMVDVEPPSSWIVSVSPSLTAVSDAMSVEPERPVTFEPVVVASKSLKLAVVSATLPVFVAAKLSKFADVTVFELVFVAVKSKRAVGQPGSRTPVGRCLAHVQAPVRNPTRTTLAPHERE